jgi:hypothetical protein
VGVRSASDEVREGVSYKGPEHRMRMMLKSHPRIPVPITAMKIAAGAVSMNVSIK